MEDDWIEWRGGECPVPAGTRTDVRLRDGKALYGCSSEGWRWSHNGWIADIVRYRISKPAEPPAPDTSAKENRLWHGYAKAALPVYVSMPQLCGIDASVIANCAADMADAMLAEAKKRGRV